ncbi:hypothetical protein K2173_020804 [Erythroxylum novogranatense]|uniref:Protein kinase domain-containing protein n=1 Tax=Erythroxylum novogranatense TaxID=1862640 RepID=A0AAV8TPN1_9ROSI|nr:hypothetical protein K2173_020804 [Erythroxylum novogranatense]
MKSVTQKQGFFVLLVLWSCSCTSAAATDITKSGCLSTCGNVSVPYPFGVDDPSCAVNEDFLLTCNDSSSPAVLNYGNMPVVNISVDEGTAVMRPFVAYDCFGESGLVDRDYSIIRLSDSHRFSDTRNKLTVLGCDTMALMMNEDENFGSGCISLCNHPVNFTNYTNCSGVGCCQVGIPSHLKTLNVNSSSLSNHTRIWGFNPCGFAFLADERTFKISDLRLNATPNDLPSYDSVVEWVIEEKTCSEAKKNLSSYACRENTDCIYSKNNRGYRCLCKEGFTGNPYLQGCQDIDECKDQKTYPCEGTCRNTIGNYTCRCPLGMHGDGKVKCKGFPIGSMVAVYEFVSNGTLFHHIHDIKSEALLAWRSRLRIAAESASALDYLHSLANPPIIHGDVKSANILLDDKYTAKVSDFGASVLISPGQNVVATKIQGTFGYLDPEYVLTGNLTAKSDVYSFGVILVELLTGKKPNFVLSTEAQTSIINHFRSTSGSDELSQLLCFEVADETEVEEIEIFAEIAKEYRELSSVDTSSGLPLELILPRY